MPIDKSPGSGSAHSVPPGSDPEQATPSKETGLSKTSKHLGKTLTAGTSTRVVPNTNKSFLNELPTEILVKIAAEVLRPDSSGKNHFIARFNPNEDEAKTLSTDFNKLRLLNKNFNAVCNGIIELNHLGLTH